MRPPVETNSGLSAVLRGVVADMQHASGADIVSIFLYEEATHTYYAPFATGQPQESLLDSLTDMREQLARYLADAEQGKVWSYAAFPAGTRYHELSPTLCWNGSSSRRTASLRSRHRTVRCGQTVPTGMGSGWATRAFFPSTTCSSMGTSLSRWTCKWRRDGWCWSWPPGPCASAASGTWTWGCTSESRSPTRDLQRPSPTSSSSVERTLPPCSPFAASCPSPRRRRLRAPRPSAESSFAIRAAHLA